MKNSEINSLSLEDLKERIKAEEDNLLRIKFAHGISPNENPMKIRASRKLIARLKTQFNSKSANA